MMRQDLLVIFHHDHSEVLSRWARWPSGSLFCLHGVLSNRPWNVVIIILRKMNSIIRRFNCKETKQAVGIPLSTWWRHQMETFSALLALCAGNSPVICEFLSQRPVTRTFDVFFGVRLIKRLSNQSRGRWFETPWRSLWRRNNSPVYSKITDAYISIHYNTSNIQLNQIIMVVDGRTQICVQNICTPHHVDTSVTYIYFLLSPPIYSYLSLWSVCWYGMRLWWNVTSTLS